MFRRKDGRFVWKMADNGAWSACSNIKSKESAKICVQTIFIQRYTMLNDAQNNTATQKKRREKNGIFPIFNVSIVHVQCQHNNPNNTLLVTMTKRDLHLYGHHLIIHPLCCHCQCRRCCFHCCQQKSIYTWWCMSIYLQPRTRTLLASLLCITSYTSHTYYISYWILCHVIEKALQQ